MKLHCHFSVDSHLISWCDFKRNLIFFTRVSEVLLTEYTKYFKTIIVTGISAMCLLHYVVSSVILQVKAKKWKPKLSIPNICQFLMPKKNYRVPSFSKAEDLIGQGSRINVKSVSGITEAVLSWWQVRKESTHQSSLKDMIRHLFFLWLILGLSCVLRGSSLQSPQVPDLTQAVTHSFGEVVI